VRGAEFVIKQFHYCMINIILNNYGYVGPSNAHLRTYSYLRIEQEEANFIFLLYIRKFSYIASTSLYVCLVYSTYLHLTLQLTSPTKQTQYSHKIETTIIDELRGCLFDIFFPSCVFFSNFLIVFENMPVNEWIFFSFRSFCVQL
jgi:hypothetical protein